MKHIIYLLFLLCTVAACGDAYSPKPRGYFRIDLPRHEYRRLDTIYPYTFDYPVYASPEADSSRMAEPGWVNIRYRPFGAILHISYKPVTGNLPELLEDAHTLVNKHIPKASAITQREYADQRNRVSGLVYEIRGADAASPIQFYLTDSTKNFVRGALYFNRIPNNDSLAPVIDFLKEDITRMIDTFRWKEAKKH